jgi:hypothetical protein
VPHKPSKNDIDIVNGIGGVNASADAPKHTIGCMLAPLCVASGFNLLEQVGDEYVVRCQLDAAGNALAESKLRELHAASIINNVQFTVCRTPHGSPCRRRPQPAASAGA